MGVPTSEVGYTSGMPRREDHEVHKDMWGHWGGGTEGTTSCHWLNRLPEIPEGTVKQLVTAIIMPTVKGKRNVT